MRVLRFLLVVCLLLFIFTSYSSAGPLKRFISKRKAAQSCPCGTVCPCSSCPQGCPVSFHNPPQFGGGPVISQGTCLNGVCPVQVPKQMPKLK